MADLTTKKKSRGGHRGLVGKLVATARELVEGYDGERKSAIKQAKLALEEKLGQLKTLDEEIQRIICEDENSTHEALQEDMEDISHRFSGYDVTDEIVSAMCEFFRNGHAICLKELHLWQCEISSRGLSIFLEVLDNKLCPELTFLNLGFNNIADEGLTKLCKTITKQKLLKLTGLDLDICSLTNECVTALCELLRNECCNLIDLSLEYNRGINDEGLRILCEHALANEHCKLEKLNLRYCSLTDDCLPELCNALQHEHCRLNELYLTGYKFTEKGKKFIREIETHELCKARGLVIDIYVNFE